MSGFDRASWEERWARALREHGDRLGVEAATAHSGVDAVVRALRVA